MTEFVILNKMTVKGILDSTPKWQDDSVLMVKTDLKHRAELEKLRDGILNDQAIAERLRTEIKNREWLINTNEYEELINQAVVRLLKSILHERKN